MTYRPVTGRLCCYPRLPQALPTAAIFSRGLFKVSCAGDCVTRAITADRVVKMMKKLCCQWNQTRVPTEQDEVRLNAPVISLKLRHAAQRRGRVESSGCLWVLCVALHKLKSYFASTFLTEALKSQHQTFYNFPLVLFTWCTGAASHGLIRSHRSETVQSLDGKVLSSRLKAPETSGHGDADEDRVMQHLSLASPHRAHSRLPQAVLTSSFLPPAELGSAHVIEFKEGNWRVFQECAVGFPWRWLFSIGTPCTSALAS